jgi:hypothetical protein
MKKKEKDIMDSIDDFKMKRSQKSKRKERMKTVDGLLIDTDELQDKVEGEQGTQIVIWLSSILIVNLLFLLLLIIIEG